MERLRSLWHERHADAAALSVVAVFFLAFFAPTLLAGKFLVAGDSFYYSQPLRAAAWDAIRRGELPLWTPAVLAGYPLLSMSQLSLAYPLAWGYAFLPIRWAEQLYVLAPFLLAPAFTYAYAREVGRSRLAALLAGFSFAYGGMMASKLGVTGLRTNGMMWLPLVLVAVERARTTRPFVKCLVGATAAYLMSVLNGDAQSFLYVGLVAAAYAAFLCVAAPDSLQGGEAPAGKSRGVRSWSRWRPFAVACGAIALSAGAAAYQIFETMRAARRSVRGVITYEVFSEGSFSFTEAVRSLLAPTHHVIEVSTYVAPLALALAVAACLARATRRDARALFWAGVAALAFLLMLGDATPLNWLVFHTPVVSRFRYPSRHAFEWSFALSVLAAYGWDALLRNGAPAPQGDVPAPRGEARAGEDGSRGDSTVVAWLLVAACAAAGFLWWDDAMRREPRPVNGLDMGLIPAQTEAAYLVWKIAFASLLLLALWRAAKSAESAARARAALLASAIGLACFVEPYVFCAHFWFPFAKTRAQIEEPSPAVRWLQTRAPAQNRIYTRVNLFVAGYPAPPALDLPNRTALFGLRNVAGYEQLTQERFSRALGNVGADAVNPRYDMRGAPDASVFSPRSRVLDLLNTTHVITFTNLSTTPAPARDAGVVERDGVRLSRDDLGRMLKPGETVSLACAPAECDGLALVTTLTASADLRDGAAVARLRIYDEGGRVVERELRAGDDTAEWAHERADVRAGARHRLATVFDSAPGDAAHTFESHRYFALVPLGERVRVSRVEIVNVSERAGLVLSKASLYDSARKESTALAAVATNLDAARWRLSYERDGVLVVENLRALPRAWLVSEAEAVDGEEALRRIRGEGEKDFDPRRTALVEDAHAELPRLPGGAPPPDAAARVASYEPARIVVETDAAAPALLVLSELFYPGWEASVDGRPERIRLTDYLLRGVAVPAGRHRVEMRYRATAARSGAYLSALTLLLIAGLVIYDFRRVKTKSDLVGEKPGTSS
ncbi:MAG: YfhO family protein [Acidobacteria bacterium]|nr:YfhO family protein [Acidobacteriota bacterium]